MQDDDDGREYAWGGGARATSSRGGKTGGDKKASAGKSKMPKAPKVPKAGGKARQTKITAKGGPKYHAPKAPSPKPVASQQKSLVSSGKAGGRAAAYNPAKRGAHGPRG